MPKYLRAVFAYLWAVGVTATAQHTWAGRERDRERGGVGLPWLPRNSFCGDTNISKEVAGDSSMTLPQRHSVQRATWQWQQQQLPTAYNIIKLRRVRGLRNYAKVPQKTRIRSMLQHDKIHWSSRYQGTSGWEQGQREAGGTKGTACLRFKSKNSSLFIFDTEQEEEEEDEEQAAEPRVVGCLQLPVASCHVACCMLRCMLPHLHMLGGYTILVNCSRKWHRRWHGGNRRMQRKMQITMRSQKLEAICVRFVRVSSAFCMRFVPCEREATDIGNVLRWKINQ